nr:Chain B, SSGKVPLS [synthetic construct]
SSGKVPLS